MFKSVLLLLVLGAALLCASAARGAPAAILTADFTGQVAFNDPIVSPGERSAHEHCFYGAFPVNQTETEATLRDGEHHSTWAVGNNRTAIWIPCVYEDGVLLGPYSAKHLLAYYKHRDDGCQPPENMAGVSHEYGWRARIGGGDFFDVPPDSSPDGALVATIFWRGERDFGVACFPTVQAYIRLNVGAGPIGHITLGGPVEDVDGATGPRHMHGDYMFAHDRDYFGRLLNRCVVTGIACGTNPALD